MSRLIEFYRGEAEDHEGRKLQDYWAFSDDDIEMTHNFISWMFPLRKRSLFSYEAPTVDDDDTAAFGAEYQIRKNLITSLDRFLAFLGLERVEGQVVKGADFEDKKVIWAGPDHNWLRIERVLQCLRLFSFEQEALALFDRLGRLRGEVGAGITPEAYARWRAAAMEEDPSWLAAAQKFDEAQE